MKTKQKENRFAITSDNITALLSLTEESITMIGDFRSQIADIYFGFPAEKVGFGLGVRVTNEDARMIHIDFEMPQDPKPAISPKSGKAFFPHKSSCSTNNVPNAFLYGMESISAKDLVPALALRLDVVSSILETIGKEHKGLELEIASIGVRAISHEVYNSGAMVITPVKDITQLKDSGKRFGFALHGIRRR